MNAEHKKAFAEKLHHILKSNQSAIAFCLMTIDIIDTWDDIYDKDKSLTGEQVNRAFTLALFELPRNQFYIDNFVELQPVMKNIFLQWNDANNMEKAGFELNKAYMLRAGLYSLFSHCALLVGGYAWAEKVGVSIRALYGETLEDYLEEMEQCQIQ